MKKFLALLFIIPVISISLVVAQDISSILQQYGISDEQIQQAMEAASASSGQSITTTDQLMQYYIDKYEDATGNTFDMDKFLNEATGGAIDMSTYKQYSDKLNTAASSVNSALDSLSASLVKSLPSMLSMINIYPDSYIGQLIGLPPHFAAGINTAFALVDISSMSSSLMSAAGNFGIDTSSFSNIPSYLPLPIITADLRIGGVILPFDLGVSVVALNKGMMTPLANAAGIGSYLDNATVNFLTLNGDFRYCVMKEGVIKPEISVGGGYTYSKGDLGYNYNDMLAMGFNYSTHIFYLDAQVSKKILFVTPFVGAKLMTDVTKVKYNWGVTGETEEYITSYNNMLSTVGYSDYALSLANSGETSTKFFSRVMPQVYGGIGFSIFVVKINTVVGYDFYTKTPSGAINLRIQI